MALLEVKGLKTSFYLRRGVIRAVNDISFSIEEGETLGLVGESGSGKSMTSLSLLRLVPPPGKIVGGSVMFDGVDLLKLSDKEMREYRGRHLSMVLQDPLSSLNPVFTIGDQIGEGITIHDKLHGAPLRQRVVEMMRAVDIPAPEARTRAYPHQLSGGMRQRVVGAVALGCRPRFLIADEPTTSLDVTIQMQYLNLLKQIQQQEKLAMLFVTHDLGVVAKMCDRVAVMYAGRIVEIGSVRQIFDNPSHPYTKALMKSIPKVEEKTERLYSIEGQPPALLDLPPECSFLPRCPESFDRCQAKEFPPEVNVAGGQCVRCWHYV
jgi:oligopeptide/dipeptide ABC transporter ATP-binding protein